MRRVMIIGGAGSGKSTMARKLGAKTGLPVFHMDHIHWKPGWVERPIEEKNELAHEVHQRERWIFEGNHSRTFTERVERADTLIWLDVPVWLRLWRINKRALLNLGKTRPDMQENCPELMRNLPEFNAFIWRTRRSKPIKPFIKNPPPHLKIYQLHTFDEVNNFIETVS